MKKQNGFSAVEGLLIVFVIAIIGTAGFYVANRSSDNNDAQLSVDSSEVADEKEELPLNLEGLKSLEEIEAIAGVSEGVSILEYKLESSDSGSEYVLVLSNGKKLVIDAVTGEVLSEETTDVSGYSSNIAVNVSLKEAYAIAAARHTSPIKEIEFEMEDNEATYKIEYRDGSKVEIDATSGNIVKFEADDDESEDEEKREDDSEEDESEDDQDEDEDEDEEEDEDDEDDEDEEDDDSREDRR